MLICIFRVCEYPQIALLFLILIVQLNRIVAQDLHIDCDTAHFHYMDYIDSLSHYENKMGEKKHLNTSDKKLKLAFYVALSHYPSNCTTKEYTIDTQGSSLL